MRVADETEVEENNFIELNIGILKDLATKN